MQDALPTLAPEGRNVEGRQAQACRNRGWSGWSQFYHCVNDSRHDTFTYIRIFGSIEPSLILLTEAGF